MNIMKVFISRPVGVTLLTFAVAFVGMIAYALLPVAPLPQVDLPTIMVRAQQPGASPETMAATVATPLERSLGRIAGVTEMTSRSSLGRTNIIIQFDFERNIDGAARDVQAAINAARSNLPTLPTNPTYFKLNPSDMPIMILSLNSEDLPVGELFDFASTVLGPKISQVFGVGQVNVWGGSLPAVRVDVNPGIANSQGISLNEVRQVIGASNINMPKGMLDDGETQWFVGANDQLHSAAEYAPLVVRYKDGATIRLEDVADVVDGVEDKYNAGYANGKPSVLLIVFRQPGANIIETVKKVRQNLPILKNWVPESANLEIVIDRSPSISNSLRDVEITLCAAMVLVVLVVWLFLRNGRATLIPAVAVPVSLLGTFGVMYLSGFSLNHLSLMALTISTGFVVDDAIVVTENIVRHVEGGEKPYKAALRGGREVCFTVISISLSLVAIFIPILGMGGFQGRLLSEFAVTLSAAVLISLVISLVTTPMMCAHLLKPPHDQPKREKIYTGIRAYLVRGVGWLVTAWGGFLDGMHDVYARLLARVLRHRRLTLLSLFLTIGLNIFLYIVIPKGLFPSQDTGQIRGFIKADQSVSFKAMQPKFLEFMRVIHAHPDVAALGGYTGGGQRNSGNVFIALCPLGERKKSTETIMGELRQQLSHIPGADLFMVSMQDVRMGGREARSQYQFTLQSDDLQLLREWSPKVEELFRTIPGIIDVNSDQDTRGLQVFIDGERSTMARYGVSFRQLDTALGLAFGQSFVSTMYSGSNQYRVVLGLEDAYQGGADSLIHVYVPSGMRLEGGSDSGTGLGANTTTAFARVQQGATLVPLHALATVKPSLTALSVSHQGQFSASTIAFNLAEGYSLSEVQEEIDRVLNEARLPGEIIANFQGTAKMAAKSMRDQPILMLAAIVTLYIVLGILYESLIHPLTILSTLPSAGVGALLGLMLFGAQLTLIAFIGVLLLAGIVKKNAIMMIDFAIMARREEGLSAEEAIFNACLLRFRPIMMTTMAAIFGALPLLIGGGEGADLRTPLGITIIGGLLVSQVLTLFTTPVVYLYLDGFAKPPAEQIGWKMERSLSHSEANKHTV